MLCDAQGLRALAGSTGDRASRAVECHGRDRYYDLDQRTWSCHVLSCRTESGTEANDPVGTGDHGFWKRRGGLGLVPGNRMWITLRERHIPGAAVDACTS